MHREAIREPGFKSLGIQAPAWKGRTGDNIISRGLNSYVVVDRVSDQIKVDLENVRPIEKSLLWFEGSLY